ncbi:MAG: hypothetical protein ACRERC_21060 [Candidatus Binatia bacterium]
MSWRGTLALVAALLAAAVYLYSDLQREQPGAGWQSLIEESRPVPPSELVVPLLTFDPASVQVLRLRSGDREWEMRRTADGWSGIGSAGEVDDFIKNLRGLAEIMPLEVPADQLADHGLDPPAHIIELERRDAPPLQVRLGRRNPPATGVYAQVGADGKVVLTGALALWELDKLMRALNPPAG